MFYWQLSVQKSTGILYVRLLFRCSAKSIFLLAFFRLSKCEISCLIVLLGQINQYGLLSAVTRGVANFAIHSSYNPLSYVSLCQQYAIEKYVNMFLTLVLSFICIRPMTSPSSKWIRPSLFPLGFIRFAYQPKVQIPKNTKELRLQLWDGDQLVMTNTINKSSVFFLIYLFFQQRALLYHQELQVPL